VVAQFAERAVDPCTQRGVARQVVETLRGKTGEDGDRIVIRSPECLRVQIAKQFYDVRVPGPPQVPRQLGQLTFELCAGRHGPRTLARLPTVLLTWDPQTVPDPPRHVPPGKPGGTHASPTRENVVIVPRLYGDGRTTAIHFTGDGRGKGLAPVSADP